METTSNQQPKTLASHTSFIMKTYKAPNNDPRLSKPCDSKSYKNIATTTTHPHNRKMHTTNFKKFSTLS
jgi:hypothetical protein